MLETFFKLYHSTYIPEHKNQFRIKKKSTSVYNIKDNSAEEMHSLHVVMMS